MVATDEKQQQQQQKYYGSQSLPSKETLTDLIFYIYCNFLGVNL